MKYGEQSHKKKNLNLSYSILWRDWPSQTKESCTYEFGKAKASIGNRRGLKIMIPS